jgi:hypothetical protein
MNIRSTNSIVTITKHTLMANCRSGATIGPRTSNHNWISWFTITGKLPGLTIASLTVSAISPDQSTWIDR